MDAEGNRATVAVAEAFTYIRRHSSDATLLTLPLDV